jgi:hypothetical protein
MLEDTYTVNMIDDNGNESILKVKNKTHFKSLSTAKKHCNDILTLIKKDKNIFNAVDCFVEDMTGAIIYPKAKQKGGVNGLYST